LGRIKKLKGVAMQNDSALLIDDLEQFHQEKQKVLNLCDRIKKFIHDSPSYIPDWKKLEKDIDKVVVGISEQKFRIAVVGEFSQGKSTLLNALLGEEIQPVRSLPCSGAISIIRYGDAKRVICRYKDGSSQEVSLDSYQELVSISQESAEGDTRDELAESDIDEVIYEHPGLDFCRKGVEIVDSPGLNEHPDRTRVTYKLLENTDAVIFLANANRLLTQTERELLQELQIKLSGSSQEAANNLFVVVNFMDQVRREDEKQSIRRRAEKFLYESQPIISDLDRLHFISAQQVLEDKLYDTQSEYQESFDDFRSGLEKYLMAESGRQIIQRSRGYIDLITQEVEMSLRSAQDSLKNKVDFSHVEKKKLMSLIGDISAISFKSNERIVQRRNMVIEIIENEWPTIFLNIEDKIRTNSTTWTSSGSNPKAITEDFSEQFSKSVIQELETSIRNISESFIQPDLNALSLELQQNVEKIKAELKIIDTGLNSTLSVRFELSSERLLTQVSFNNLDGDQIFQSRRKMVTWATGAGVATIGTLALIFGGPIIASQAVAYGISAMISSFLQHKPNPIALRGSVVEGKLNDFDKSRKKILDKVIDNIYSSFDALEVKSEDIYRSTIALLDSLLKARENDIKKSEKSRSVENSYIEKQISILQEIQNDLSL
jgi:GTPase SAR1 family protein